MSKVLARQIIRILLYLFLKSKITIAIRKKRKRKKREANPLRKRIISIEFDSETFIFFSTAPNLSLSLSLSFNLHDCRYRLTFGHKFKEDLLAINSAYFSIFREISLLRYMGRVTLNDSYFYTQ